MDDHKMDGKSVDVQGELIAILKERCPEVFSEGKVDAEKLRQILGDEGVAEGERYGLSWAGKMDCFRHIQEPTTATLNPVKEESVDFDNTENIFIEGDNLQVLKTLQKTYHGKIKMIYIDPPYNTGKDTFIYPDRFQESKEEYLQRIGEKDVEGNLIRDGFWRRNSKDTGHFHSNWLSMLYPRLFLAKNLLRDDGVIFISIDDNEVHNLKMIMDEIYGEDNFVGQLVWKKKYIGGKHAKHFVDLHEYVLVFAKNILDLEEILMERPSKELEKFCLEDEYIKERGKHYTRPLKSNLGKRGTLIYPIELPDGKTITTQWMVAQDTFESLVKVGRIIFKQKKDGSYNVYRKYYEFDNGGRVKVPTLIEDVSNADGKVEIKDIFGVSEGRDIPFDNPKPTGLIKHFIKPTTKECDIVLDFFSGSCTTAHAVMALNSEDGLNRKYICVQLPEPCDEDSEAFKAGYETIADIGKERIRRAGKKIKEEKKGKLDFDGDKLDLGFKVFNLEESNFKQWRSDIKTAKELEKQLSLFVDNVKPGVLQENILYELILKTGHDLNVKVEAKKANGKQYFVIDDGKLIVCLEEKITKGLVEKITKLKPEKVICLDKSFSGDDQLKTNTALQMQAEKIEFKVI